MIVVKACMPRSILAARAARSCSRRTSPRSSASWCRAAMELASVASVDWAGVIPGGGEEGRAILEGGHPNQGEGCVVLEDGEEERSILSSSSSCAACAVTSCGRGSAPIFEE